MSMEGSTVMLTVEQESTPDSQMPYAKGAVNAWMEFDNATEEAYICLREMSNWDGVHKGIQVVRKTKT